MNEFNRAKELDEVNECQILERTNGLLQSVGFAAKQFTDIQDLRRSASSMFVAILEKLLNARLSGIVRVPKSNSDYIHNSQRMLQELDDVLPSGYRTVDGLPTLNGEGIARGDFHCISTLLSIFSQIHAMVHSKSVSHVSSKLEQGPMEHVGNTVKRGGNFSKLKTDVISSSTAKKKSSTRRGESASGKRVSVSMLEKSQRVRNKKKPVDKMKSYSSIRKTKKKDRLDQQSTKSSISIPSSPQYRKKHAGNLPHHSGLRRHQSAGVPIVELQPQCDDPILRDHMKQQKLGELRQKKKNELQYRNRELAARLEKIRISRLHEDLRMQQLASRMRKTHEEEMEMKRTLNRALLLERNRLIQEKKKTVELVNTMQQKQRDKKESIRNFYEDQIDMVKEKLVAESHEQSVVEKANRQALSQYLREIKTESEKQMGNMIQIRQKWVARDGKHLDTLEGFRMSKEGAKRRKPSERPQMRRNTRGAPINALSQKQQELYRIYGQSA